MNMPDKPDMVPESLRKELCDFVNNNANMIFCAAENFDRGTTEMYSNFGKFVKNYQKQIDSYHGVFTNLLVADNFDKVAFANLVNDLICLLAEQNRMFEDCRNILFEEYRSVIGAIEIYLAFVSNEGIDFKDILDKEESEK